jgi:uncharacterized protein (DUF433 family)
MYSDAEPLLRTALGIYESKLGPDHPDVADTLNKLASLYLAMSRYADAQPLLRRALKIRESKLGPEHPGVAEILNNLAVVYEHIGIKPGFCGGKPHILGHRIKVQHVVVWHEQMGMSPAEIVVSHPTISLSDVYAAFAYYHDHRDEIDADIVAEEKYAAEIEAKYPSWLQEKLRQRNAKDDSLTVCAAQRQRWHSRPAADARDR